MLFRQMIVEYQQIAPVIDRRRTMLPNDPTTRFAACATVIGIHLLIKLMTLGLTEAEAEEQIINGFLK